MGAKELQLLGELVRVSENGKIVWQPTARLNEFLSAFRGRFSILVGRGRGDEYYLRMKDLEGGDLLSFQSPSLERERVTVSDESDVQANRLVRKLYDTAQKGALHITQSIDEILQELKRA